MEKRKWKAEIRENEEKEKRKGSDNASPQGVDKKNIKKENKTVTSFSPQTNPN